MALESLDEIDDMSRKELWKRANETLEEYRKMRGTDQHTLLVDAEFYLRQVRDKDERRRRRFELILEVGLELVIIGLIVQEINDGKHQAAILKQLSANTASTATVLSEVQTTMADMNRTIQAEREQASRISIEGVFDGVGVIVTNKSRPNLLQYGTKLGDSAQISEIGNLIPGSGTYHVTVAFPNIPAEMMKREMGTRQRHVLPVEIYLESDDGTQYVATATLTGTRNSTNDAILIAMDPLELEKKASSGEFVGGLVG